MQRHLIISCGSSFPNHTLMSLPALPAGSPNFLISFRLMRECIAFCQPMRHFYPTFEPQGTKDMVWEHAKALKSGLADLCAYYGYFPGDLDIVQGFCEVEEKGNILDQLVF